MLTTEQLKHQYETVCKHYISRFCRKQEMEFTGWVAGFVGEIAICSDFFFNFSDIMLDMNTKQPKGKIIEWYDQNLEGQPINYHSFTKGLRAEKRDLKAKVLEIIQPGLPPELAEIKACEIMALFGK